MLELDALYLDTTMFKLHVDGAGAQVKARQAIGGSRWPPRATAPPPSYLNPSWSCDRDLRRRRNEHSNEVERFFRPLKRFRRFVIRSDLLDLIFISFIHLGPIEDAFQLP